MNILPPISSLKQATPDKPVYNYKFPCPTRLGQWERGYMNQVSVYFCWLDEENFPLF